LVIAFLTICVLATFNAQRRSFLAIARLLDNPDPVVHGWLQPWIDGYYMDRQVRCACELSSGRMKKVYSISISTCGSWAFKAQQKNILAEFSSELRSTGRNNLDEDERHCAFTSLAFPEGLL
jgi:hypothetical protein